MRDPGIGRVLVASLHEAIADVLPTRLIFYEEWLTPEGLREGSIGLAPLYAVLSFLRQEGDAYDRVMTRAGVYAAEWSMQEVSSVERAVIDASPSWVRARLLVRLAARLVSSTYQGSRASSRVRGSIAQVSVRDSIFCSVREPSTHPLCGFYAAAFQKVLALFEVPARASVTSCRSTGQGRSACVVSLELGRTMAEGAEAPAA